MDADRVLGERFGFISGSSDVTPDPADAARAAIDPRIDHMAGGADLAAVLGPVWCGRGWHDGVCCEGSRKQWDVDPLGPRPYLGSS